MILRFTLYLYRYQLFNTVSKWLLCKLFTNEVTANILRIIEIYFYTKTWRNNFSYWITNPHAWNCILFKGYFLFSLLQFHRYEPVHLLVWYNIVSVLPVGGRVVVRVVYPIHSIVPICITIVLSPVSCICSRCPVSVSTMPCVSPAIPGYSISFSYWAGQ